MVSEPAAAPARWIDVAPERFPGWIESFGGRHGAVRVADKPGDTEPDDAVVFMAADGAVARAYAAFPPVPGLIGTREPGDRGPVGQDSVGQGFVGQDPGEVARVIASHAAAGRTVGVLLVRLGGYAAGVFAGYPPALADSKVGSRLVHGRSAAGGWSQQRFARRREKEGNEARGGAADTVATVFARWEAGSRRSLDAVVLGGDKRAVAELRGDPRLAAYFAIATERFLTVPDPKRAVLDGTPKLFTAVRIRLTEPSA